MSESDLQKHRDFLSENTEVLSSVDQAIDKIDQALPSVKDLEAGDDELDELAEIAKEKVNDLIDLGMNMDPRFSGQIFQTASNMLGHAITAKTAKMDKKLKMIQLQLQKAKLDYQIEKDAKKGAEDEPEEATGMVIDRNELLRQLIQEAKTADVDK